MGKIERKRRVDLAEFDPTWKDSFVILVSHPYKKVQELTREIIDNQRAIHKAEKQAKQLLSVENPDDEILEEAQRIRDNAGQSYYDIVIGHLREGFRSGKVFDTEGGLRDMTADDINDFDIEVLEHLFACLTGQIEKKG